jgi:DNA-binding Lrp family transcriptional regulator
MRMKEIELKLLAELLKNSRRSDRDLAKVIGTSQPTVTRTRIRLEKEGYLKEYTVISDFHKLGFELLALTFIKLKVTLTSDELEKIRKFAAERLEKTPYHVLMFERGAGLGFDGVVLSVHKNYASYNDFRNHLRQYPFIEHDIENFLISLEDKVRHMPLSFKILAKHLMTLGENGQ